MPLLRQNVPNEVEFLRHFNKSRMNTPNVLRFAVMALEVISHRNIERHLKPMRKWGKLPKNI